MHRDGQSGGSSVTWERLACLLSLFSHLGNGHNTALLTSVRQTKQNKTKSSVGISVFTERGHLLQPGRWIRGQEQFLGPQELSVSYVLRSPGTPPNPRPNRASGELHFITYPANFCCFYPVWGTG
jgi:hypothetical protein